MAVSPSWPAHTQITDDAIPTHPHALPASSELASVVVAEVLGAEWRSDLRLHVTLNATLRHCSPDLSQVRLIGRQSVVSHTSAVLEAPSDPEFGFAAHVPADVARGDLIVIPCRGATLLHDITTHS